MRRLTILMLTIAMVCTATAQERATAREELKANKFLSASNYLDYDNYPATKALTPTPKGYEPYLMNHYGRHGSRWLINETSYTRPLDVLRKADKQGKLTAKGQDVLRQVETVYASSVKRLGDLSSVGERQHHGIGRRMAQHFPEIFKKKDVPVDARSTVVIRCILSMVAECEELAAANPTARFHNDVSDSLQFYLNQPRSEFIKSIRNKTRNERRDMTRKFQESVQPERMMQLLFNDGQWAADSVKGSDLMYQLFEVASNMQSHELGLNLYPIFTDEEIYQQWRIRNIGWYLDYGAAQQGDGLQPFSQLNLLKDIIHVADTTRQTAAVLRFGHEVCVMPLACLLEVGSCGISVSNMDELDAQWRNYDIFPMACNIQLVFYRPQKGKKGDILVKALLNEREVSLPVKTDRYPYYCWDDLRQYYLDKISSYEAKERAFEESRAAERAEANESASASNN
ncbi:MAG: histidine-type phosphatase [Prevotella sp.]|nr:histidine-type phosphatase [Prevotella sp.]